MSEVIDPPEYYFSNINFNPAFYANEATGFTQAQANALYLRKTVPDTATALETFNAGINVNALSTFSSSVNVVGGDVVLGNSTVPTKIITLSTSGVAPTINILDTNNSLDLSPSGIEPVTGAPKTLNIATGTNVDLNVGTGTRSGTGTLLDPYIIHNYSDGDNCLAGNGVHLNNGTNNGSNTNIHNGTSSGGNVNIMTGASSTGLVNIGIAGTTTNVKGIVNINGVGSSATNLITIGNSTVGGITTLASPTTNITKIVSNTLDAATTGGALTIGTNQTSGGTIGIGSSSSTTTLTGTVNLPSTYARTNVVQTFNAVQSFTGTIWGLLCSRIGGVTGQTTQSLFDNTAGSTITIGSTSGVTVDNTLNCDTYNATTATSGTMTIGNNATTTRINIGNTQTSGRLDIGQNGTRTGDIYIGGAASTTYAGGSVNIGETTTTQTIKGSIVNVGSSGSTTTIKGIGNIDKGLTLGTNGDNANHLSFTRNGTYTMGIGPEATPTLIMGTSANTVSIAGPVNIGGNLKLPDNSGTSTYRLYLASDINHTIYSTGSGGNKLFFVEYGLTLDTWNFYNSASSSVVATISSTGIYATLSDRNKKKDFEPSTLGLNEILQLKPTLFRYKNKSDKIEETDKEELKSVGFIAQEVQSVLPQAYMLGDDFIGLDYNAFIPVLVKAVQEMKEDYEAKFKAQEERLSRLEALFLAPVPVPEPAQIADPALEPVPEPAPEPVSDPAPEPVL